MASEDLSATFSLDLQGNIAAAAQQQAAALEDLQGKIQGGVRELREMQAAMRNLNGGSAVNIATMRELRDRISAQKATVAQLQQRYIDLGGSFKSAAKGGDGASAALGGLLEALRAQPGPLGAIVGRLGAMKALFASGIIVASTLALGAALMGLAVAAGVAIVALTRYGIAQADARRSEQLRLEGLTKIRYFMFGFSGALGRAAMSGAQLQGMIDRVSGSVALGRSKVAEYTEQLYRMGLRGGNLQAALEGVAMTAAVQGDQQAQAFAHWAAGANMVGQSVKRLTQDVKARLGGIAAAQLLALDAQTEKLKENFALMFTGLKIEPLLRAVSNITAMFSQSTASGRALKVMFQTLVQPLIDAMVSAGPVVKRFFQGVVIGALMVTIALLQLRNWFRRTFGDSAVLKGMDLQRAALMAGVGAVGALVGMFALLAVGIALVLAPIAAVGFTLFRMAQDVITALKFLANLESTFASIASSWIDGLINGIKAGISRVTSAITELGNAGAAALHAGWQIRSPSRVSAKAGLHFAEGPAVGIRQGIPQVEAAVADLGDAGRELSFAPPAAASPRANAAAPAGRSGPMVEIHELHVHAAEGTPDGFAEATRRKILDTLQGLAIEIGAVTPQGAD